MFELRGRKVHKCILQIIVITEGKKIQDDTRNRKFKAHVVFDSFLIVSDRVII